MGARRKGRILAFQTLYAYELCSHTPVDALSSAARLPLEFPWIDANETGEEKFKRESTDFARLIAGGALEKLSEIDGQIKIQLEHWDFSRLNKVDQAILRLGVYGLMFQMDIPASVTIDEAVDIAKEFGTDESYRFINGVLDGIRKNLKR